MMVELEPRAPRPRRLPRSKKALDRAMYAVGISVLTLGFTYATVPLYRQFCQATGFGGATQTEDDGDKIARLKKVEKRLVRVGFSADTYSGMQWNFKPQQNEVWVHPGETALAFYTATNPTDKAIIGISTYNITPFRAALYFVKIQCFCFEEQILNPGEQVDMPVFFYIDPEYVDDPSLEFIDNIQLSYTFFDTKSGEKLPSPLSKPL